jgi:drug/metabolite transporter (DMT)-like permease
MMGLLWSFSWTNLLAQCLTLTLFLVQDFLDRRGENSMNTAHSSFKPVLAGIVSSLIFGFSFLFSKVALDELQNNTIQMIAYRFGIAAVVLGLLKLAGVIKISYRNRSIAPLLWLSFFYPFLYFIFEAQGIRYTSSSEAGTMIALIPIAVTIMATIFLKEKTTLLQWLFIVLSVGGVLFINLMKFEAQSSLTGILYLLAAIVTSGVYNILSRKSSAQFSPLEITYVMMWTGALIFNAIALGQHAVNGTVDQYVAPLANPALLQAVLYLGVLSSVVAFFLMNYMLAKLEASKAASYWNLSTGVSIIGGVLILHESFYWYQAAGIVFILIGVWGANRFGQKQKQQPSQAKAH